MTEHEQIDSASPLMLTISSGQQPQRLDQFLTHALPQISRHKVHQLIEAGLVTVDDHVPKKSHKISPGEVVAIYFKDQPPQDVKPEAMELDIAYEDEHLLIVNKPAGMVVHPAHGHFEGTLVNGLLHHLGLDDVGPTIRPGIVHRLDKGTSGLLVVAKSEHVHRLLTEQFSAHTIKREYAALAWGRFDANEGTIDEPIGRHPGDRKRFSVVRGGKLSVTHYTVHETFASCSFLTLRLETGRTHQIRVHLSHIRHPIVGDPDYGGREKRLGGLPGPRRRLMEQVLSLLDRPALHARTLQIFHPVLKKDMKFEANLTEDFVNALEILRSDSLKDT
ncbi:RluA family pseudouridine synthase [bacterium]|nr:RluA family pseudouridine synthase [bacterium]